MTIKQLPARLDLEFCAGDLFALTATSTGATITSPEVTILSSAGDATALAFSDVTQLGADTVCSLTAVDSATFNTTTRAITYKYVLTAVVDGFGPYSLMAGTITAKPAGSAGTSTSTTATLAVTVGGAAVSVAVSVGGDVTQHIADTVGAHAASAISVTDVGGYFVGDDAEEILAEIGASFARTFQSVNVVTAATYAFVAADQADIVVGNSASSQTFTLPPAASVPAMVGTSISVFQKGAGTISFVGGSGVTLVLAPGTIATTAGVGAAVTATLLEADTWYISGALSRSDVYFIPANEFRAVRGSPSMDNYGTGTAESSAVVWLLDAATRESIIAGLIPPWRWNTGRVDLWWGNASTAAGNVVWQFSYQAPVGDGGVFSTTGSAVTVTAAAPTGTTRDVKVSTLLASLPLAGGQFVALGVSRLAADAADTLANDARIIGLSITRLT